jgi:hypothetical protein
MFRSIKAPLCLAAILLITACGKNEPAPAINESGLETMHPVLPGSGDEFGAKLGRDVRGVSKAFELDQPTTLRYKKGAVLELKIEVPAGTQIEVADDYQVATLDFRKSDGTIARSSTGFITPIRIVAVPTDAGISQTKIDELNATVGGLYVTASVVGEMQGVQGNFDALAAGAPGQGYLKEYDLNGRPKFNYSAAVKKRFGAHVNKGVDPAKQTVAERTKWAKILGELRHAADRTKPAPKAIIMIDKALAVQESLQYEADGTVPLNGAWTIATQATAVRHGFPNVPCAETMSEFLREAYERAGYSAADDFNDAKGNRLIWSGTSAVVNFSAALDKAGWVPWDARDYRPVTGALLMNANGNTPGHTYISAGEDGRFIVDNGSPQGRDLRTTVFKTIDIMYQTGVFFLPPGINPPRW